VYFRLPGPRIEVEPLLALAETFDLTPGPGGSRMTDWQATKAVFESVLPTWGRRWLQAALVLLYPSSQLVGHADPPIEGGRYHLPLAQNEDCWVFHDGTWQQLQVGRWYKMDPALPHGAVNWGTTRRMHLLVDVD